MEKVIEHLAILFSTVNKIILLEYTQNNEVLPSEFHHKYKIHNAAKYFRNLEKYGYVEEIKIDTTIIKNGSKYVLTPKGKTVIGFLKKFKVE